MDHTPGPWRVADWAKARGDVLSVCKGFPQKPVAKAVGQQDPDERAANARLIAAAPEMLDALKLCAEYLGSLPAGGTREPLYIAFKAAEDAIGKAQVAPSAGQKES